MDLGKTSSDLAVMLVMGIQFTISKKLVSIPLNVASTITILQGLGQGIVCRLDIQLIVTFKTSF